MIGNWIPIWMPSQENNNHFPMLRPWKGEIIFEVAKPAQHLTLVLMDMFITPIRKYQISWFKVKILG